MEEIKEAFSLFDTEGKGVFELRNQQFEPVRKRYVESRDERDLVRPSVLSDPETLVRPFVDDSDESVCRCCLVVDLFFCCAHDDDQHRLLATTFVLPAPSRDLQ